MLKVSENMGIDVDPWSDTERKAGRRLPQGEMPLNAETLNSQLKNLTIEDTLSSLLSIQNLIYSNYKNNSSI